MTLQEILDRIPKVKDRRYWLVRTDGGKNYESFLAGKFIAIGYNKITLNDIKSGNTDNEVGINILSEKITGIYGEEELRPKHAARQLIKFSYEIKKGDIIMIPSENSEYIQFAEILNTSAFNEFDNKFDCDLIKRKEIKLVRQVSKNRLDPKLYKLMFSHHTITDADQYGEVIDKIINGIFVKLDHAHLVLEVQAQNDVKARSLFKMGDIALDLLDDFCKKEDLDYKSDDFDIKLAVQSPGFIEISGLEMGGIIILGIILVGIAGGGFSFNYKTDLKAEIKTDGIIEKVRRFLTTKSNNDLKIQLLQKHMENLEIKDPAELIEILKQLDK
jgi:restriction system protein